MSASIYSMVSKLKFNDPRAKSVTLWLASEAEDDGYYRISPKDLSKKSGIKLSIINSRIHKLQRIGVITDRGLNVRMLAAIKDNAAVDLLLPL